MQVTATGVDWQAVQSRLASLGFDPGPIDGLLGPKTWAAIVAFKRAVGLNPRPLYGPITHDALMGAPAQDSGPAWLSEARRMLGVHERRDNARLRDWMHVSVAWADPAEIAWCGSFVATCIARAMPTAKLPDNPLGARNWNNFGEPAHGHVGAVAVFWRGSRSGWQGHVGFAVGQDATAIHVLGGNQSDAVTITRIGRDRLIGYRWPAGQPAGIVLPQMTTAGKLSTNEA